MTQTRIVNALFPRDYASARLAISTFPTLASPSFGAAVAPVNRFARSETPDAADDTQYYGAWECDGVIQPVGRFSFKTFPAGNFPLKMIFAGDRETNSNNIVYDQIRDRVPHLLFIPGDVHYENAFADATLTQFQQNWRKAFRASRFRRLVSSVPTLPMWDNHDYVLFPQDGTNPARDLAVQAARQCLPLRFRLSGPADTLSAFYKIGRTVILISDLRAGRMSADLPDGPTKRMMNEADEEWFLDTLADPAHSDCIIEWVSPAPWIDDNPFPAGNWGDSWSAFPTQRRRIADQMKAHCNGRVFIHTGDMHAWAYAKGAKADYATGGGLIAHVVHSAPLDHRAVVHVGPFDVGPFVTGGNFRQFTEKTNTEISAEQIDVTLTGFRSTPSGLTTLHTRTETVMFS